MNYALYYNSKFGNAKKKKAAPEGTAFIYFSIIFYTKGVSTILAGNKRPRALMAISVPTLLISVET